MGNVCQLSVWNFNFAIYFLVTTYKSSLFQVPMTLCDQKIALDLISSAKTLFWVELKAAQKFAKLSTLLTCLQKWCRMHRAQKKRCKCFSHIQSSHIYFKSRCSSSWNTGPCSKDVLRTSLQQHRKVPLEFSKGKNCTKQEYCQLLCSWGSEHAGAQQTNGKESWN